MKDQQSAMKQELIELQTQLAFQEDVIETLDEVVTRQQQQLETMQVQINALKKRFESLPETLDVEIADEKPPHY